MANRSWKRCADSKKMVVGKKTEFEADWLVKRKYSAYKDGNFFIGNKLIPRWHPGKEPEPEIGIWLNSKTGRFEIWKDCQKLSDLPWKTQWRESVLWAHRFGYDVTHE